MYEKSQHQLRTDKIRFYFSLLALGFCLAMMTVVDHFVGPGYFSKILTGISVFLVIVSFVNGLIVVSEY